VESWALRYRDLETRIEAAVAAWRDGHSTPEFDDQIGKHQRSVEELRTRDAGYVLARLTRNYAERAHENLRRGIIDVALTYIGQVGLLYKHDALADMLRRHAERARSMRSSPSATKRWRCSYPLKSRRNGRGARHQTGPDRDQALAGVWPGGQADHYAQDRMRFGTAGRLQVVAFGNITKHGGHHEHE
jgi:hypothetical protein